MKKVVSKLLLSLIAITGVFAAPKKSTELNLEPIQIELPSLQGSEFLYTSDPRIEIVGILGRLAGYEQFSLNYDGENAFLSQIDQIFAKYKNHKLVKKVQQYKKAGITDSAWLNLAYHIKPDFSGTTVPFDPYPAHLNPEWNKFKAKELNDLVTQIHDFVIETNFSRICLLNQSTYLNNIGWLNENVEPFKIHTWGKEFFNDSNVQNVVVNISYLCAGNSYFDYVTDSNNKRAYYITIAPGCTYYDIICCYSFLYTMDYAIENWDAVKENFIKYRKDFAKKYNPNQAKEIDNYEFINVHLALLFSDYLYLSFNKYFGSIQTEKQIEKYGNYAENYDSIYQYLLKNVGPDAVSAIDLLNYYLENREKYPTFKSFAPKLNEYINSLKVE